MFSYSSLNALSLDVVRCCGGCYWCCFRSETLLQKPCILHYVLPPRSIIFTDTRFFFFFYLYWLSIEPMNMFTAHIWPNVYRHPLFKWYLQHFSTELQIDNSTIRYVHVKAITFYNFSLENEKTFFFYQFLVAYDYSSALCCGRSLRFVLCTVLAKISEIK